MDGQDRLDEAREYVANLVQRFTISAEPAIPIDWDRLSAHLLLSDSMVLDNGRPHELATARCHATPVSMARGPSGDGL